MQDPAIKAIRQRLERWELDHLRTHAAQLADRIESLERELYRTQDEAEYWHRECQNMVEQLQADARDVGLTQAGELVVMKSPSVNIDTVHRVREAACCAAPKTAVLWMPQGAGKSTHGQAVADLLGCTHVVDEWCPGKPLEAGALHLTNVKLEGGAA